MIRYAMVCRSRHEFEGWFGSSAEFDEQKLRGLLTCPVCGDAEVEKALMAPSLRGTKKQPVPQMPAEGSQTQNVAAIDQHKKELIGKIRELRKAVLANTEDVGKAFGEEARKIHYGETEARGIRGQADRDEAVSMIEEGIDILPLPELPEDQN